MQEKAGGHIQHWFVLFLHTPSTTWRKQMPTGMLIHVGGSLPCQSSRKMAEVDQSNLVRVHARAYPLQKKATLKSLGYLFFLLWAEE